MVKSTIGFALLVAFCLSMYSLPSPKVDSHGSQLLSLGNNIGQDGKGIHAHSIILFIGDGMGGGQRTAARWSSVGENGQLVMDTLPESGWSHTGSANSEITDSAAGATALATGVKTNNGMIGIAPNGTVLETILERAKAKGMAVGLVTTAFVTDATPASFAAHVQNRSQRTEIARQLLEAKVDVLLGGGEDDFLPTGVNGHYPLPGNRSDGRNLIDEAVSSGYAYVYDGDGFSSFNSASTQKLFGLFADLSMSRPFSPSLAEMTQKSIDILSRDPDGFFLMVEGGQIDVACHSNDASNAIADTIGLDQAITVARTYASEYPDTLIIVTADHETGGMSVTLAPTGLPGEDGPFTTPDGIQFYVNWTTVGHTSSDVPTTGQGPWSGLLNGTYENTGIYGVMNRALDWWVWLPVARRN